MDPSPSQDLDSELSGIKSTNVRLLTEIFRDRKMAMLIVGGGYTYNSFDGYECVIGNLLTDKRTAELASDFLDLDELTPANYSGPKPLGLKSIQVSLFNGDYNFKEELALDVYRMFETCRQFFPKDCLEMARELCSAFTAELRRLDSKKFQKEFEDSSGAMGLTPFESLATSEDKVHFQAFLNMELNSILDKIMSGKGLARYSSHFITLNHKSTEYDLVAFREVHKSTDGPLDFKRIRKRIRQNEYKLPDDFYVDMGIMTQSCRNFFDVRHPIVRAANKLDRVFRTRFEKILTLLLTKYRPLKSQNKSPGEAHRQKIYMTAAKKERMSDIRTDEVELQNTPKKPRKALKSLSRTPTKQLWISNDHYATLFPMSFDEKIRLREDIFELVERDEQMKICGIVDIIQLREPHLEFDDRFDIDFEGMKTSTLRALEGFVAGALRKKIPKLSLQKFTKTTERNTKTPIDLQ